jgi:hypothetical protein
MGRRLSYLMCIAVVLSACTASWGQKKASNPNPANGAGDVAMPLFRWTAGSTALFHDVYLGKTPQLGPQQLVGPRQILAMYYYAPGLEPGVTYYWRVDEIDQDGVTVYTGDVWSFATQALTAYNPDPADGTATVSPAAVLKWWPGQGAVQHHVYFSGNRDAVSQAAAGADKGLLPLAQTTFTPGSLQGATTYYWRVDELLSGGVVKAGPVWSFTTIVLVDDFESYTDVLGSRIYETWIDGYTNNTGSTVGYAQAPFAEQKIVHSGLQSMPLDFNNVNSPFYSEAERQFASPQDWTVGGTDTLVLYIRGRSVDFQIPYVSTPPVIDGKVDDVWSKASIQPISTTIVGTPPTSPADCSGQFRELYDADNLYVLVDVNDDKLHNDSTSWYLNNSVEVYIDGDNTKAPPGLSGHNRQYTFCWSQAAIQGTNTDLTGVQFAQVNTPTGFRVEIKLPWKALIGASAPVGKLIGVDCFINDSDNGGSIRDRQLAWHSTTGNDWQTAASWGTAKVAPAASSKPDPVYVALQDSSNHTAMVLYPDPQITQAADWVQWKIPLTDFTGVNLAKVKKMTIGVGDKAKSTPGGLGLIYIDDISLATPAPAK